VTPQELIREIISLYHGARNPLYPHERLFRGESRPIASQTEDLFARYLINRLPDDVVIYVNQTITTVSVNGRIRIKPDLTVTKGTSITAILDLKMDLGYRRKEFPDFWRNSDQLIPSLRNKTFSMFVKTGSTRRRQELTFGGDARLFYVLVSSGNINAQLLSAVLQLRGTMQFSDLVVLTEGVHPNTYGLTIDETLERITINEDSFSFLETVLN
jgi:hypothetical protein